MCKVDGCTVTKIKGYGYCNTHYARFKRNGNTELQELKRPIEERFWRFVTKLSDSECWEWQGSRSSKGYGKLPYGSEQQAHRVSYIIFKGEIPDKMMVLHHCDNPSCVNPSHLYLGDNQQNMIDMISRGRAKPRGKKPTLTDDQVRLVAASTETVSKLKEQFGVGRGVIELIKSGKTYKHLDLTINKASKGETKRVGNENGMSRICEEDVLLIRESTESNRILGMKYGVSTSLVSMIKNRKVWSHI